MENNEQDFSSMEENNVVEQQENMLVSDGELNREETGVSRSPNISTYFGAIPDSELHSLPSPLQRFISHLQDHVQLHLRQNNTPNQVVSSNQENLTNMEEETITTEDEALLPLQQSTELPELLEETPNSTTEQEGGEILDTQVSSSEQSSLTNTSSPPPRARAMIRFVIIYENVPESQTEDSSTTPENSESSQSNEQSIENETSETHTHLPFSSNPNTRHLVLNLVFNDSGSQSESFHDLMNRFFMMHEPRGPPPTSKKAIEQLRTVEITEEIINGVDNTCSVCFDEFVLGNSATGLPCHHVFHKECLNKWLEEKNTCPLCRYELPTDDEEYEKQRVNRMAERKVDEDSYFNSCN